MAILAGDAVAASCLVLLTVSACTVGPVAPPPAPLGPVIVLPPAKTAAVLVKDLYYVPDVLETEAGTTVVWTNQDVKSTHTATFSPTEAPVKNPDGSFDLKGALFNVTLSANGGTASYRFATPGTYYYYCLPHEAWMRGKIVVKPSSAAPATPVPVPASGAGMTATKLAEGKVQAPHPAVRMVRFGEPSFQSTSIGHRHESGFVYSVEGTQRISLEGGTADVAPGQATFIPTDTFHTHMPAPGKAITVVAGLASQTNVEFGERVLYDTPELPPFPEGAYGETLWLTTLEPGGRTPAQKHGGLAAFLVLDGTLDLRVASAEHTVLGVGQGAYLSAGTVMQAVNGSDRKLVFLAFFITRDGEPFSTNVDTAP
ncbi:MAG: hypothetical protein AUH85_09945 [Chloroflexi bacterium 13_1_40CM_4_68_4]|nr:MAG: hypothetical protein AUH85_09945 [Chloroflexi bacterium 13_1_40CM_4_68_4]